MAKRRKIGGVENQGFGGMDLSVNPQRMAGHVARVDMNGDHRWPQSWHPRPGMARGSLAKQTGIIRNVVWFKDRSGVERVFYFVNSTGKLEGTSKPLPGWNPAPVNVGGAGFTFNPVTLLVVSDTSGLTLTWTNPTSAFWVGTKVLRRTDCYPQGPNDPAATTVYNGRLATATDSALAVGSTGYYSAYAYTKAMWAAPAKVSGTRAGNLLWGGTGTGNWKTGP